VFLVRCYRIYGDDEPMMVKGDYEAVASALVEVTPYMRHRLRAYRAMVRSLAPRNPEFDALKFAGSMRIPRLLAEEQLKRMEEVTEHGSKANREATR